MYYCVVYSAIHPLKDASDVLNKISCRHAVVSEFEMFRVAVPMVLTATPFHSPSCFDAFEPWFKPISAPIDVIRRPTHGPTISLLLATTHFETTYTVDRTSLS